MAIAFLLEIMIYVISCIVVAFMRGFMQSFREIIACVFINEMVKIFFRWYYGNGAPMQSTLIPEQSYHITEQKTVKNIIPIVYSFMIFKICEAIDIKVELAAFEKRDTWGNKVKKTTKCIPIVQPEIIFKICNALNLPAKLELTEGLNIQVGETTKTSTHSKVPPVVNSIVIYKICLALGLPAQLNEEA
ncbi:hypothetical protein NPIL_148421 [Nephila pilipes]|uniref:Uncharacterized protein n=1 Tax=Nephila pilipes TaxID=299642 RepID=A0A8X6TPQ5_NEPPI|nr:hypothetical protein NPIL_148421 [Nephila pilipes]